MKNIDDVIAIIANSIPGISVLPGSYKKTAPMDGRDCYEMTLCFNGHQKKMVGHIDRLRQIDGSDDEIISDIRQWTLTKERHP